MVLLENQLHYLVWRSTERQNRDKASIVSLTGGVTASKSLSLTVIWKFFSNQLAIW
jgi:hypothetical protein